MSIYMNNSGAGLISSHSLEGQIEYLRLEQELGATRAAQARKDESQGFYQIVARGINAESPDSIAFVDSASRAWDAVLYGFDLKPGDEVITLSTEFGTNLVSLYHRAAQVGATIRVVRSDEFGRVLPESVEALVSDKTRLIAVSHAIAHGSVVNDVLAIGAIAEKHGIFYLLDGCQSMGQMAIDVQQIKCDAFTATGRKWLRGPRGTGFLYIRPGQSLVATPYVDLASADLVFGDHGEITGVDVRSDARQFELWERSMAGMLGLKQSVDELSQYGVENAARDIRRLSLRLVDQIKSIPGLKLIGADFDQTSIIGLYGTSASRHQMFIDGLTRSDIAYSTMSDWDAPIHFRELGISSVIRLAPHYYTTELDVDTTAAALLNSD